MKLADIDLNLLITLDVLLEERSVSRAAARLYRTQSTLSHSLKKLREIFNDELLVRSGHNLTLTSKASQLIHPLKKIIHSMENLITEPTEFTPQQSKRIFRCALPDFFQNKVKVIIQKMRQAGPNLKLHCSHTQKQSFTDLLGGNLDIVIAPPIPHFSENPDIYFEALPPISWALYHKKILSDKDSLKEWIKQDHIRVNTGVSQRSPVDDKLSSMGLERKTVLIVPHFLGALEAASQSDLMFLGPKEPLIEFALRLGLKVSEPPINLEPIPMGIYSNQEVKRESAIQWFHKTLKASFLNKARI